MTKKYIVDYSLYLKDADSLYSIAYWIHIDILMEKT